MIFLTIIFFRRYAVPLANLEIDEFKLQSFKEKQSNYNKGLLFVAITWNDKARKDQAYQKATTNAITLISNYLTQSKFEYFNY